MSRLFRVYLSGPITKGDRTENFRAFCQWQKALMKEGFAVLNPGLSMLHPDAWTISHEDWLESDLPWVAVADAVVRIQGDSEGADAEVGHAYALRVPVFYADRIPFSEIQGMEDFLEWVGELGKTPEAKESPVMDDEETAGGTEAPRSFEIGDLVRVVGPRDVADAQSGPGFSSKMRKLVGLVFEIEEKCCPGEFYLQGFHFLPHWLEPANARKFNVGDKVRLRDPGPKVKGPWVPRMEACIGLMGHVVDWLGSENFVKVRFSGRHAWFCLPEWLDLIEPAQEAAKEPEAKPDTYPHADDVCDAWAGAAGASIPATAKSILDEAKAAVTGDRQASYGPPDQDFARTAGMWSALFSDLLRDGVRFEPFHVAQAMILLKMSRQRHQRKRDNWVDAAGYAHCGAVCDEVAKG